MPKLNNPTGFDKIENLDELDTLSLNEKMATLDRERSIVKDQLDKKRLTKITNSLIETITSPAFVERMREFRDQAAKGASFSEAGDLMSLENLKASGAVLPDDFRITSRVFEDREAGIKFEMKHPTEDLIRTKVGKDITDLIKDKRGEVAWGACAGGGAASVCGCAGGGT